jgi:hypothetical protein
MLGPETFKFPLSIFFCHYPKFCNQLTTLYQGQVHLASDEYSAAKCESENKLL